MDERHNNVNLIEKYADLLTRKRRFKSLNYTLFSKYGHFLQKEADGGGRGGRAM